MVCFSVLQRNTQLQHEHSSVYHYKFIIRYTIYMHIIHFIYTVTIHITYYTIYMHIIHFIYLQYTLHIIQFKCKLYILYIQYNYTLYIGGYTTLWSYSNDCSMILLQWLLEWSCSNECSLILIQWLLYDPDPMNTLWPRSND